MPKARKPAQDTSAKASDTAATAAPKVPAHDCDHGTTCDNPTPHDDARGQHGCSH